MRTKRSGSQIRKFYLTLHDALTHQYWGVLGPSQALSIKRRKAKVAGRVAEIAFFSWR